MPTPTAKDIPYQPPVGPVQSPKPVVMPKGTQGPSSPQTSIGPGQKGPYGPIRR